MLTITYKKVQEDDYNGNPIYEIHGFCLDTDTKPTQGIGNGSDLIEMNTSTVYFFDREGQEWLPWGADADTSGSLSSSFSASPTLSPSVQPISLDRPGLSTQEFEPDAEPSVSEEPEDQAVSEDV